jgi:hypothetical protein
MTLIYKTANIEDVSKLNDLLNKSDKISKPIMTIYEFDKIMGMRTQQLASGSPPFIDVGTGIISHYRNSKKDGCPTLLRGFCRIKRRSIFVYAT